LFGNKVHPLSDQVANVAGAKSSIAHALLSAIAPVALGFIGKHVLDNGLSAGDLLSWLTGQKSQIESAMPAGLNLASVFGSGSTVHHATEQVHKAYIEPGKKSNKFLPLLLGLLALGLIWYFVKSCNKETPAPEVTAPAMPAVPEPTTAPTPAPAPRARESMKVKLADGTEIDAYKGGIEDHLVAFLNDPNAKVADDLWFDFDNLTFESGSARITAESGPQVNNIAATLKAYPNTQIKIGGYTDVTGDAAANLKLSRERAEAVVAAVEKAGANPKQLIGAEGYGSKFAKAAADAPDSEKEKDRRIAVSVRRK
jgi:outer membrane protein OmpA-like peptidoglycan-associated protein